MVLISASTAMPAPARAADLRGAMVHAMWTWDESMSDVNREFDLLQASGANAVRIDMAWANLEPVSGALGTPGNPYVQRGDQVMAAARAHGLRVVVTLMSSPCWAASAPAALLGSCVDTWRYAPVDASRYAAAAAWVASRWRSDLGGLEIWNEPDQSEFLVAADPAASYAQMLKLGYAAVKAAAPGVPVIGGVLAGSDGSFLQRLYDLGIKGSYDALSIHPYTGGRAPDATNPGNHRFDFVAGVEWVRSIMDAHGDAGVPLWLTEFGWATCCVTPDQQAEYINEAFRIASGWSRVGALFVYNLRDKGTDNSYESSLGMVRRDFQPKPALAAFTDALAGRFRTPPAAPPTAPPAASPPPDAPGWTPPPADAGTLVRQPALQARPGLAGVDERRGQLRIRFVSPRRWRGTIGVRVGSALRRPARQITCTRGTCTVVSRTSAAELRAVRSHRGAHAAVIFRWRDAQHRDHRVVARARVRAIGG